MGHVQSRNQFVLSAKKGDLKSMKALILEAYCTREEAADAIDSDCKTALHYAAFRGDVSMTRYAIKLGCNVNAQDKFLYTPLHHACEKGQLPIVKLLLLNGANVNIFAMHQVTALHCAARFGFFSIVRLLLDYGASVHVATTDSLDCNTALHYAARLEDWRIARLLLHHGADPAALNYSDRPAMAVEAAESRGEHSLAIYLKKAPMERRRFAFLLGLFARSSMPRASSQDQQSAVLAMYATQSMYSTVDLRKRLPPIRRSFANHPLFTDSVVKDIFSFLDDLSDRNAWPVMPSPILPRRTRADSYTSEDESSDTNTR